MIKNSVKNKKAPIIKFSEKETKEYVDNLDFQLTDAQRKTSWEILGDIQKNTPMSRLLEGDVGSGKTVVASIALLNAYLHKRQAALMVPTEILAEQHFQSIKKLFINTNAKINEYIKHHLQEAHEFHLFSYSKTNYLVEEILFL
jgi:ATP-dependent DNA helicase RecG